jgi:hypothetical protein
MPFQQGLQTTNVLVSDQQVASSVVPVDITGFSFLLGAAKRIYWNVAAIFTLGATGGFRFLAHSTQAPTTYNAAFNVQQATTPSSFGLAQFAEAAFANASAVAATYQLYAQGFLLANAATTFSFQFAQNTSDVLPIVIKAGAVIQIWQF